LLITIKPDIIHINNGGYPGAETCSALFLTSFFITRAKTIYQINNLAEKRSNFIYKKFDYFLNNHVSCFINASFKAKDVLVERRDFSPEKIFVVNNCVPLSQIIFNKNEIRSQLDIPSDGFLIVNVAFLTKRKGQIYLIEAINKLLCENLVTKDKFFCALVGNGEDYELLRNRIKELGLHRNIFLLGYKNNSDDYINASDLFILPSISNEDMPLVILSALGYGKPIISTDFAGISQVINSGHNGLLVNKDLDSLTMNLVNALRNLYNDNEFRINLGKNAKAKYFEYSPIVYGENLKNIYNNIYAK
jgi:glycosyltransferase involved in cell wall biosynthesis